MASGGVALPNKALQLTGLSVAALPLAPAAERRYVRHTGSVGRNMEDVELLGPRIRIRRARLDEADARFRWFANPTVTEYLPLAGERILPLANVLAFLEKASRDDDPNVSVRIELLDGRVIGCGGLRTIVQGESAEVSVVIGEPDVWSLGYGREAMALLLEFGFDQLHLRAIWLIVRTENTRAVRLFTRLGFVVVETLEASVIVRGIARSKLRMQLSEESWRRRATTDG